MPRTQDDGPKDFLNQPIATGDTVVYPNRKSSNLWMNKAQVISMQKITDGNDHRPAQYSLKVKRDKDGDVKTLTRLDRVVVLTGVLRVLKP